MSRTIRSEHAPKVNPINQLDETGIGKSADDNRASGGT
ncbi:hypothetical protein SBA5_210011 [Candidatus Sulfotelmatomonas gaucii]|uniref:Uncharacterized protein n=1 Tax=Candidatus Sulfuritelmatomonas gaucii TaxID=2043161 RepID=A0A2N9L772_9BACT|nr:hypothetical protein SBA5_210011 [Candidatus Sulfotelmatomonas gaucii]